jgi:hypothetical protein
MPNLQRIEKFCSGCKTVLPIERFSKPKRDGYTSRCSECLRIEGREKHKKNMSNPEYRAKKAKYMRELRLRKPRSYEQRKKEWLKSLYGMTVEDYNSLLNSQNEVCAICSQPCKTKKGLAVDHNHITGKIRGLLCANCNGAIGMLQEDPDIIEKAKQYIIRGNSV